MKRYTLIGKMFNLLQKGPIQELCKALIFYYENEVLNLTIRNMKLNKIKAASH